MDWEIIVKRLSLLGPLIFIAACAGSASETAPPKAKVGEAGASAEKAENRLVKEYEQECTAGLEKAKAQFSVLEQVQGDKTVASVLTPLNQLWMTIDYGVNRAGLFGAVHPDQAVRDAADTCEQEYRKLVTTISLSRPLYDAVSVVDVSKEDEVTQRYFKHVLRDFRRSGVNKDAATRDQVRKLTDELVQIGQTFGKNIRSSVRSIEVDSAEALAGLPQDYIESHKPGANGKITLTTNYPDYIPFMTYAKNDAVRLKLYKEFRKRGYPDNGPVLDSLLGKRYELATLLGYKNWAHYITEDKMIKTETAAKDFIEKISGLSQKRAAEDYGHLLARLQKELPEAKTVGDWQKSYVENLVKKEEYNLDSQAVRKYLTYNKVRQGIFDITGKMFGITYVPVPDANTWHESVETYEMVDTATNVALGRFHLDMHPRDNKYKHAAAFPIQSGVEGVQIPMASLVCNFPKGRWNTHKWRPSFMSSVT